MFLILKKRWTRFAALGFLLAAFSLQAAYLPPMPVAQDCACNAPVNATKTVQTSNSVSFAWDAVAGATTYEVWYVRVSDGYQSPHQMLTGTTGSYSGLPAGRYVFYISTQCGDDNSQSIIMEDILMG